MKKALSICLLLAFTSISGCSSADKSSTVEGTLVSHRKEFRACYFDGIEGNPAKPSGIVTVYFIIGADGSVHMAGIKKTTLHVPQVEACVLDLIKTITFPTPKNGDTEKVTYPFKFTSK